MPKNKVSNLITEQLPDQESDLSRLAAERLRKQEQRREQVLDRLWEISKMSPEMTRGSITGQVKALAMIVAIEGLIPDRRAEKKSAPPLPEVDIYPAAWLGQQEKNIDPQPDPPFAQEEDEPGPTDPETPLHTAGNPPPPPDPIPNPIFNPSGFASRFSSPETTSTPPHAPSFVPDTRVPFSIKRNPFGRRR